LKRAFIQIRTYADRVRVLVIISILNNISPELLCGQLGKVSGSGIGTTSLQEQVHFFDGMH
jgi:hypothetical protein